MDEETERTRAVVTRYHQYWMDRDIEGVLGMFHPQVQYCDFYNDLEIPAAELPAYIRTAMPRSPQHRIEHIDKIRADGDTAFIQYQSRLTLRRSSRLASFRASEAITVRDGLIWRVHEYATPVREQRSEGPGDQQRLGLSSAQVGKMLLDIESYFGSARPYLDPEMDLERLARATGYTRNQISYLLNQVLGQSFYRYLNQARIVHLLERLREEPAARIDELAFAVGFNSLSVFYRCFREHTGQPPRAYLAALATQRGED
ncbi:AraC-like DNA-binding protein [Pseudomonas nitritireducens]|uniref:AraC-like DNA-binding protein n=1 Tax=Pseudomonas nitroreducens TaxID=46680 RepID=A0A7W7P3Y2_PSENT|nr:nuclear transport factor 2 family protein [Pseudomonas nitritireducens]MBB4865732.1 AraC-like DNA-binding protein [Pseudomonas nitritireducens]